MHDPTSNDPAAKGNTDAASKAPEGGGDAQPTGPNSVTVTRGIRVHAAAQLVEDRSFPDQRRWLYAYRIQLENVGDIGQRLISRHWVITDANGETREVKGAGVVGDQPHLVPGETYEYRSSCEFPTAWGTMEGTYRFVIDGGEEHDVQVGRFFLVESAENAIVLD